MALSILYVLTLMESQYFVRKGAMCSEQVQGCILELDVHQVVEVLYFSFLVFTLIDNEATCVVRK